MEKILKIKRLEKDEIDLTIKLSEVSSELKTEEIIGIGLITKKGIKEKDIEDFPFGF